MYYLFLYMYLSFISSITCMHEAQSRSFSLKIAHIHCHESIEKVWHVSRQVSGLITCMMCAISRMWQVYHGVYSNWMSTACGPRTALMIFHNTTFKIDKEWNSICPQSLPHTPAQGLMTNKGKDSSFSWLSYILAIVGQLQCLGLS